MVFLVAIGVIFLVILIVGGIQSSKVDNMAPDEREEYLKAKEQSRFNTLHGELNPSMVCPHCNEKGQIRTKTVDRKKGISGGKATAALFTGGVSMLATGLSRKERLTEAHCASCKNLWIF